MLTHFWVGVWYRCWNDFVCKDVCRVEFGRIMARSLQVEL